MDNQQDAPEVLETPDVAGEPTQETPEAETDAEKEQLKKALTDLESKNKQLFARLKKAEEPKPEAPQPEALSNKDLIYIAKADIHADDVEEVLELARLKKLTVQEAHAYMKPILETRADERKTAAATHTKGGARGSGKVSGEDILKKAEATGSLPDTDEGMLALTQARLARKRTK